MARVDDTARVLTIPEAIAFADAARAAGRRMAFTSGCFDLIHPGHIRFLQAARRQADRLVVGILSDPAVREGSGGERPLNPEDERAEILSALDCVDAVVIADEPGMAELLQSLRPDVQVIAGDSAGAVREAAGARIASVVRLPRVPGHSTRAILQRIRALDGDPDAP